MHYCTVLAWWKLGCNVRPKIILAIKAMESLWVTGTFFPQNLTLLRYRLKTGKDEKHAAEPIIGTP